MELFAIGFALGCAITILLHSLMVKPASSAISLPQPVSPPSSTSKLITSTPNSRSVTQDDAYFLALEEDRRNAERERYAISGGRADA